MGGEGRRRREREEVKRKKEGEEGPGKKGASKRMDDQNRGKRKRDGR